MLGQLSDDLHELRRIANGETSVLADGFVWLTAVLRAVGEEVLD